jgi:hypothetical protein
MNALQFILKWRDVDLSEKSASQQHFLDLCELLGHPKPVEVDKTGESFTFEKGAAKRSGGDGWADVWKKRFFAWEYKGKHKDLDAAYKQLLEYREALESPPLLVVSDMDRIEVHTDFTSTPVVVHEVRLDRLSEPRSMEILDAIFHNPDKLRPGRTSQHITDDAAGRIAHIAQSMRERGLDPHQVAHFLDRIVFCLFAEDIELLPKGLFSKLVEKTHEEPARFARALARLFDAMADGGELDFETIRHFNGNLFVKGPVLEMTEEEIERVYQASKLDWGAVDPSIFGTLFERGMDPDKRSQIGAHYTSREDIETLVEPVVMWPLRREWEQVKQIVENLLTTGRKDGQTPSKPPSAAVRTKSRNECDHLVRRFHEKLTLLRVLDPACGSGNFLYVTLQKLKDLEKEVIVFAGDNGLGQIMPMVGPWQLFGIEISPYAYDLAQMVVWIGYLQWLKANGFGIERDPVLKPMEGNFQNKDAILDLSDPGHPKEPDWPRVDCIVGNPPFLGGNKIRQGLGDQYTDKLFGIYNGRLPAFADLCCYWFEKARAHIEQSKCRRAGLLATQGIRGGANRKVLERIKQTGDIFFAESDRAWVLDGANVHVSMVGFDDASEENRRIDGKVVGAINANLTSTVDVTSARPLPAAGGFSFMGPSAKAPFDINEDVAREMLTAPNPSALPNSDVVVRVQSAVDLVKNDRRKWTLDFARLPFESAIMYEAPFEYAERVVRPIRAKRSSQTNEAWWQYERPRDDMRQALAGLARFVVTPGVAKHRLFVWRQPFFLCNQGTLVFARSDDYFFGVLHSRLHEVWARAQGTQLRERGSGFRYTPTTCFETFPFPWPPSPERSRGAGHEPQDDAPQGGGLVKAIANAARELNELRERWLNPPEWTMTELLEFPGSLDGPWARYVHDPDQRGIGTVRYPRIVCNGKMPTQLKKRTLTNLYNEMPTWLRNAHAKLDEAVFAAYAATTGDPVWRPDMTDEDILEKLLELNLDRARSSMPTSKR